MSDRQLRAWEERTTTPIVVAALTFLAAYAWPILEPDLPRWGAVLCEVLSYAVWAVFAVDVLVRLRLTDDRRRFLLDNWLDVLTLLAPMFRPLRAVRVIIALNVLGRRGQEFMRGRVVAYVVGAVAVICGVGALAVLDAERDAPDANITGIGDALWWAVTTVTTVGYGDRYPTTTEGRFVAVGLMLTGIALLGVVTAALASWFVDRIAAAAAASDERTEDEVADLATEVHELRREIAELRARGAADPPTERPGG